MFVTALRFAGVQEALTRPSMLEHFLENESAYLQSDSSTSGQDAQPPGTRLAPIKAQSLLMLKPQREGGGNNVYCMTILAFLGSLRAEEHEAWIAIELIETPREVGGYLVCVASSSASDKARRRKSFKRTSFPSWASFGLEKMWWSKRIANTRSDENNIGQNIWKNSQEWSARPEHGPNSCRTFK
ncbi:hypothetical protein M405DRAFT_884476 [Rhizopogon salebrosus TDB-379]|nr:hypothetical protein M405DRAFT_884476 [Rhizopogon salebrosus TDB-379]